MSEHCGPGACGSCPLLGLCGDPADLPPEEVCPGTGGICNHNSCAYPVCREGLTFEVDDRVRRPNGDLGTVVEVGSEFTIVRPDEDLAHVSAYYAHELEPVEEPERPEHAACRVNTREESLAVFARKLDHARWNGIPVAVEYPDVDPNEPKPSGGCCG